MADSTANRLSSATRAVPFTMRETVLTANDLIYPVFVHEEKGRAPVGSMPGVERLSIDELLKVGEQALELGLYLLHRPPRGPGRGLTCETEQVPALILIHLEYLGEGVQHMSGDSDSALFDAGVVVGADRCQLRHLLPPQACHSPSASTVREPDLARN